MSKRNDLAGRVFGRLTAVSYAWAAKHGAAIWLCHCSCGNNVEVRQTNLLNDNTKSCGCLLHEHRRIDLTGQRFGRWTVVRIGVGYLAKGHKTQWLCRCVCGTEREVASAYLRKGTSSSCGCLKTELLIIRSTKYRGRNGLMRVFNRYKSSATERGYTFLLSEDQCKSLFSGDCHWCGGKPSQVDRGVKEGFVYNGIDRVNNSVGYELGNVVSCCGICNLAKKSMTEEQFRSWVAKVYFHLGLDQ